MKIINPYTEILTPLDGQAILQHIELCGRVCYIWTTYMAR